MPKPLPKLLKTSKFEEIETILAEMTNTQMVLWYAEAKLAQLTARGTLENAIKANNWPTIIRRIDPPPRTKRVQLERPKMANYQRETKRVQLIRPKNYVPFKQIGPKLIQLEKLDQMEKAGGPSQGKPVVVVRSGPKLGQTTTQVYTMVNAENEKKRKTVQLRRVDDQKDCPHAGLNYGPLVYKTNALPLSYKGDDTNEQKKPMQKT